MSGLQREIGKRQPFASPHEEAVLNILRTGDQLQIRFTRLFRRYHLTPAQYNILRILRGEGRPLPVLSIAGRLLTVVPGITGLIGRLEQAGWVQRRRSAEDRRIVYVTPTDKALETLGEMDAPVHALHQSLLGHMSGAELTELNRLLEKIRSGLQEVPEM